jgi:hypothetical protein
MILPGSAMAVSTRLTVTIIFWRRQYEQGNR